jgi:hypothetical protein
MKKGVKKAFIYFAVFMGVLMLSGVFAESIGLSEDVEGIVNDVIDKKGINQGDIQSVEEVSFEDLPDQIELGQVDTTNIAIYKVDYGTDKPLFVLTASDESLEAYKGTTTVISKVMFLNFGYNGMMEEPGFLNTATGVEGSLEKGYVMMRKGSITGLSTNIDVLGGEGEVEVVIYINGEVAGFRNTIIGDSTGVKKDYDTQSLGVVNFEKGDVISVYVNTESNIVFKDVINLVEISVE